VPLVIGSLIALRSVFFIGLNEQRFVTVYRGLPYDLPLGVELYQENYESGVPERLVPPARRTIVLDQKLRSQDDAYDLVAQLERGGAAVIGARNRELLGLIPAALLVTAGFAAIFIQQDDLISDVSLTYGAIFLGLTFAAHMIIRFTLPHADPYLFPLVAILASFGIVMIYRIDEDLARDQATWFVAGLVCSPRRSSSCATTASWSATGTRSRWPASCSCCCRACPGSPPRSTARTSACRSGPCPSSPPSCRRSA
jgi:hypothetical protein